VDSIGVIFKSYSGYLLIRTYGCKFSGFHSHKHSNGSPLGHDTVILQVDTSVSEEHAASIFRIETDAVKMQSVILLGRWALRSMGRGEGVKPVQGYIT
jgi:hypothetical protein